MFLWDFSYHVQKMQQKKQKKVLRVEFFGKILLVSSRTLASIVVLHTGLLASSTGIY